MSILAIILIVVAVLAVLFFIGGLLYVRRREQRLGPDFSRHVRAADAALEQARAEDKGWDRAALETAARECLAAERPGFQADELHLVLVDDRPGVTEDRAEILAVGADGSVRIRLIREAAGWKYDSVE